MSKDQNDFMYQLKQLVPTFTERGKSGIEYLKKYGLYMYLQIPSPKELLEMFEKEFQEGRLDQASYSKLKKSFEGAIKSGDTKRKTQVIGPGFEPKDTLPRPFTMKAADGQVVKISTGFMDRFELITEMDLQRIIRNSSIILTNFTGPLEQDNFKIHLERLKRWISESAMDIPGGFTGLAEFVISIMILDNLLPTKGQQLPTQEFYYAGLIIGAYYRLFPIYSRK